MRKQTDHSGAFRQLLIVFSIISWIAFVYFFITEESRVFFQVNNYGLESMGVVNSFTTFITAVIFTILLLISFFPAKKKKKE
jgi:hypothetical protein